MMPQILVAGLFLSLSALRLNATEPKTKPAFEQYLKASAVSREVIDRFLRGPSWAQFDPELGYILGNYLPDYH
jgi:2-iminoacetate synthase ThiH